MNVLNLVLFAAGGACIYFGLRIMKKFRALEDTPTGNIRTIPQGHVELKGLTLALDQPAITNHKGEPVVFKRIVITEDKPVIDYQGKASTQRVTVSDTRIGEVFYLKDATGVVEIRTDRLDIDGLEATIPYIQAMSFAGGGAPSALGLPGGGEKEVREIYIPVSQQLLVHGTFNSYSSPKEILSEIVSGFLEFNENMPSFLSVRAEEKIIFWDKMGCYVLMILGTALVIAGLTVRVN